MSDGRSWCSGVIRRLGAKRTLGAPAVGPIGPVLRVLRPDQRVGTGGGAKRCPAVRTGSLSAGVSPSGLGEGSAAAGAQEIITSIVVAGWDASTEVLAGTRLAPAATHPQTTFFLNVR